MCCMTGKHTSWENGPGRLQMDTLLYIHSLVGPPPASPFLHLPRSLQTWLPVSFPSPPELSLQPVTSLLGSLCFELC